MEDQDPLSGLSETMDIKVEEFSDEDEVDTGHELNVKPQDIVQVNIKCEEHDNVPLNKTNKPVVLGTDYEWSCNLCTKTGKDLTKFKHHLSCVHYSDDLMALWPGDPDNPCPYCQKCLFSDTSKVSPSRLNRIILNHLGSAHNLVLQYLDDTLRSEIENNILTRPLYPRSTSKQEKFDCSLCTGTFKSLKNMKQHIGWMHFGETILKESGSVGGNCGKCEYKVIGNHMGSKELVCHLISKHGYLYKVVPEDVAEKLLRLDKTGNELKGYNLSKGLVSEGMYKCPYCNMKLKLYSSVVKHVVQQHLMNDILSMSGSLDTGNCNFCTKMFTRSSKETPQQKLVCHLATAHGYLEKTLTDEAKRELDKLKDFSRKKDSSLDKDANNTKINQVNLENRKRRRYKYNKECGISLPVMNLQECLSAFKDAQANGVLMNEPYVGVKPGYDGRQKSFIGGNKPDDWQCFLCLQTGNGLDQLKNHLATRHFRQELTFFWQDGDFGKPCPYCHRTVYRNITVQDEIRAYCAITHLARHHELIKHVTSDDIREALEDFSKFQDLLCCPLCKEDCKSKSGMENHLILEHHGDEVKNASKSSDSHCGICNKQFSDSRLVLLHVALQHKIMEMVFPKDVLDYLENLETNTPKGTSVQDGIGEIVEQDNIQMNFVDIDSVEEKMEAQVETEPATDDLEIYIDKRTKRKKKRRIQNQDEILLKQDLSDIIITDSSIGNFSC